MLLAASMLSGCRADKPAEDSAPAEKAARSEVERGPVRVTVEVTPGKIRLSDEPTLTLSIAYPEGVTVRKPPFGQSLGDFLIRDFREPLPQTEGDLQVIRQVYRLEPTRTGKLSIWPIVVTFEDKRPGADGKQHTVETEGLTVEVATVLGSEVPTLDALRPSASPEELPVRAGSVAIWACAMVLLVLAVAALAWYVRRRRRAAVAPPFSPRELALQELEHLLRDDLASHDVKRFYVELTAVVRRYIERTTGVRAPEQTTEEFLREIRHRNTFPSDEGRRLGQFLESADLVKFAAHEPREEDVREAVERARVFVGGGRDEG